MHPVKANTEGDRSKTVDAEEETGGEVLEDMVGAGGVVWVEVGVDREMFRGCSRWWMRRCSSISGGCGRG